MDETTLRQVVEEIIPFNKLLGMKLEQVEKGRAVVRIPFVDHLIGDVWRPAVHGGVISTLIDATGGAAGFTAVEMDDRLSTVDMRVDYLRPATKDDLIADARVVRVGNRVCVVQVEVTQPEKGEVVADGRCVYNIRRGIG